MQQVNIKFNSAEQVRQFVNIINNLDTNFDLSSENKTVNAKAILGVMTLDLSKPLFLRCYSDDIDIGEKFAPFLYLNV